MKIGRDYPIYRSFKSNGQNGVSQSLDLNNTNPYDGLRHHNSPIQISSPFSLKLGDTRYKGKDG